MLDLNELQKKRTENLLLYKNFILPDIESFFIDVIKSKTKDVSINILAQIQKDFAYGKDKTQIDLDKIEIFPKKNKYDIIEYKRTIVKDIRINYSLEMNDDNSWCVVGEQICIPYNCDVKYIFIKTLQEILEEELNVKFNKEIYDIHSLRIMFADNIITIIYPN